MRSLQPGPLRVRSADLSVCWLSVSDMLGIFFAVCLDQDTLTWEMGAGFCVKKLFLGNQLVRSGRS